MKSIISCIIYVCICLFIQPASAQTINWANPGQAHIVNAHIGADYGVVYGAGYAYKTGTSFPLVAKLGFSVPSGNQPLDDFATQYGIEMQVLQWRDLRATAEVQGIYRRFQNDLVTAKNFGAKMSISLGLYKSRWFAAAETGFDKAIVTHFQHSASYEQEFPMVKNGWYHPPTGGNFSYGLRTGLSFNRNVLALRLGSIVAEDFKSRPMLPFYVQLGYNYQIPIRAKH
jgi:hypothetical protein